MAARIEKAGGVAVPIRTDVTRREDLHALVALARERFGRLDVLFGNAGVGPISPLDDLRVDEWDEMVDVNVKGLLHGIAAALPVFRAQGSGHFVTTASTAGLRVAPNMAVYSRHQVRGPGHLRGAAPGGRRLGTGDHRLPRRDLHRLRGGLDEQPGQGTDHRHAGPAGDPARRDRRAVAFAIEQPAAVDVNEIVVRPTAQA